MKLAKGQVWYKKESGSYIKIDKVVKDNSNFKILDVNFLFKTGLNELYPINKEPIILKIYGLEFNDWELKE